MEIAEIQLVRATPSATVYNKSRSYAIVFLPEENTNSRAVQYSGRVQGGG
jgi:hypothetical protein